ncbi:uncharacterized protein LOC135942776 [Cloeon dipterum]|uniref:uncharacterized protein LOC135942776 n=1 Tax=Cloeon dipterum TaxID=197152 RepID=UPI00322032CA
MHSSIKISNLNNSEVLSYPLVMIKGQVIEPSGRASGVITAKMSTSNHDWPVVNGKFKILLLLEEGMNNIELIFESASVDLDLKFEPQARKFVVTPVYIVSSGHDGTFQGPEGVDCSLEAALARIKLGVQLLQSVVAEKLWEQGLGRRTFSIDCDPVVHSSSLTLEEAQKMSQDELWSHYGRDLVTKWGAEEARSRKFVAFLSCTRYEGAEQSQGLMHDDILALTKGHAALGGGGLAIFGTGCLHTWPRHLEDVNLCFGDTTEVDQQLLMDDSGYRGTYGGCYSTTLGAVLHELCHTFDLGHTKKGIMGRGFDRMDLIFSPDETQDTAITPPAHHVVDFTVNLKVDCITNVEPKIEQKQMFGLKKSRSSSNNLLLMDCRDQIYFTQSCAYILAFHKWMIDEKMSKTGVISFDSESWTLKSSLGLKVIEIREGDAQLVCNFWTFSQSRLLFVVPRSNIPDKTKPPLMLFTQDIGGNIFKSNLSL